MTAESSANVAFMRLTAYSKLIRGWHLIKREKPPSLERDVRKHMKETGVGEVSLDTTASNQSDCGRYHRAFLQDVATWFGLPPEEGALGELCYLFFHDVDEHEDGERIVYTDGPFLGEPGMFLNIHQVGSGHLTVAGRTYPVAPGDAYLLNPQAKHRWQSRHFARCKALSFLVPKRLVPELLRHSGTGLPQPQYL